MLKHLKREPGFYRQMWLLALPLIAQNLITTSLGFMDTFMVGLLGQAELSAVAAANSPIFLMQVIIFGMMSGLTILVSQYWGKGDPDAINRCMGVALYIGVSIAAVLALTLFFAPQFVMGLVTNNALLIRLGAPYLRIVGLSYIFNAASSVYISVQRSTENPLMGTIIFAVSMLLNTGLNYVLIFGHFGAPAMGITGAAVATLTSRIAEFLITLTCALKSRRIPLRPVCILQPGKAIFASFIHYSTPVLLNESLWGLGTTVITVIMGHMLISEEMLAAYAIMGNIDKFSTVVCFGIAGASAILVGKRIGEGMDKETVYSVSWCLLLVTLGIGLAVALCLAILLPTVLIPYLYPLFHLDGLSLEIAISMCILYIITMPARAFDITNITGILRAGGDSRMATVIDLCPLWLVAVPITALFALVLDLAPIWVCLAIQSENFAKMPFGILRLRSRKWIHDVTRRTQL